jgi:ribosomal protein L11 methyltransferase
MRWLELTVQVHPEAVESVSELLGRYSTDGIVIEEPFELSEDGQEYRILYDQPVKVHAYLPMDGKEGETQEQIEQGLWHLSALGAHFVGEIQTRQVAEEDWAHAWKDYYYVTHIGSRLVIRPSWREYTPKEHEVVVTLDPGMAFGTGVHPTTRMCLELVERLTHSGMRVLDVGTGSGILSLAAAQLGARSVYAIDNSSVAYESATENVAFNNLQDRIEVVQGELDREGAQRMAGQYDLVVANIIAHVIGSIAPELAEVVAPGGLLVVSGIIEARRSDAEGPLLEAGLRLVEETKIDDWLAIIYTKPEQG